MKIYNYNGLNAHDVANNIIANEEKYMNVNLDSLTFEEKCRYAREFDSYFHPLAVRSQNVEKIARVIEEIKERAEAGDALALFTLAYTESKYKTTDSSKYVDYLKKAMDAGSYIARIEYSACIREDNLADAQAMLDELIDKFDSDSLTLDELVHAGHLCRTVAMRMHSSNERYNDAWARIHRVLVLNGRFSALLPLQMSVSKEEKAFLSTVKFLVGSYLYEKHSITSAVDLGWHYTLGNGCDIDYEKAKSFYIDRYFGEQFDRSKVLTKLEIAEDNEDLIKEAELAYKAEIESGSIDGYWKLIVLKVLGGNAEELAQIFDDAIEKHPDELKYIFPNASVSLSLCRK